MYFVLPIRYRHTATWVISDQTAKVLTDMKFEDGRPVIINEHVAKLSETGPAIFFGDLKRALIVGERKAYHFKSLQSMDLFVMRLLLKQI